MTEIDFIPQWYRAGRRRKQWYQRQSMAMGIVVTVIVLGCFTAGRSLSVANAQLSRVQSKLEAGIHAIQQYKELQARWEYLNGKAEQLDAVCPRTRYAAVIAELSHCIDETVVLKKMEIKTVPITHQGEVAGSSGAVVQLNRKTSAEPKDGTGPTQTEISLNGIATSGSQVGNLIASLEESIYFRNVIPVYSKNVMLRDMDVTEFEIRCILADYEEEGN